MEVKEASNIPPWRLTCVYGEPRVENRKDIPLVPKVENPSDLKDFRPISLCNVIYKVVSKCLVNRLRPFLHNLIAEEQSAFVPGRMITDNALIAFECIHAMRIGTEYAQSFCACKLDLSKAYRVDWAFLEGMLSKLGFSERWISWIMKCVTSVKYSVKFNGNLQNFFTPSQGLRQGDPLSPYLFLFVADGLSLLMKQAVEEPQLQAISICRQAPRISHLLFADDTMLMFRANGEQARKIKEVLKMYESSTSQLINPEKCLIMFGAACPQDAMDCVCGELQVQNVAGEAKYPGLPPEGRMKRGRFQTLRHRFGKRMNDWSERHISEARKEVLIKSVAQALPTYIMGVF